MKKVKNIKVLNIKMHNNFVQGFWKTVNKFLNEEVIKFETDKKNKLEFSLILI